MSLRDTILQADDIAEEVVDVPEWDGVKILLAHLIYLQAFDVNACLKSNLIGYTFQ